MDWIQSFLSNRTQEVVLKGKRSFTAAVTSGVPQGTVCGPVLFLCYINDCLLYRNINATADADKLQDDIDRLQKWEADWLMEFNPDKCEIIRITNRRQKKVVSCYSIHGKALKEVTGAKYPGETINRKLTWNDHIANITKKANNTRAFLQHNISSCPLTIKSRCYQTFVRLIVEYA